MKWIKKVKDMARKGIFIALGTKPQNITTGRGQLVVAGGKLECLGL